MIYFTKIHFSGLTQSKNVQKKYSLRAQTLESDKNKY